MQYPRHLILDITSQPTALVNTHWTQRYFLKTQVPTTFKFSARLYDLQTRHIPTTAEERRTAASVTDATVISFLRKEVIYTKLKYSRCPQYDIVSGGMAALFSAFLGFLISEKFGLELVDSGDFYFGFMYAVFLTFSCRPLVKILNTSAVDHHPLSPKHLYLFYHDLMTKLGQYLKYFFYFVTSLPIPHIGRILRRAADQEQVSVWWRLWCYMVRFVKNYPLKID